MPGYRRYDPEGRAVFVTVVTHERQLWLGGNPGVVISAMRRVKALRPFRHLAHVVLPDHLHWLFAPVGATMSAVVAAVKRDVTWRLRESGFAKGIKLWQGRFYDHIMRSGA